MIECFVFSLGLISNSLELITLLKGKNLEKIGTKKIVYC